jgi:hypothetical protein
MFEKKKIFVFSAARFIISEWLMTRNYPDIITYAFCKKRVVTTEPGQKQGCSYLGRHPKENEYRYS